MPAVGAVVVPSPLGALFMPVVLVLLLLLLLLLLLVVPVVVLVGGAAAVAAAVAVAAAPRRRGCGAPSIRAGPPGCGAGRRRLSKAMPRAAAAAARSAGAEQHSQRGDLRARSERTLRGGGGVRGEASGRPAGLLADSSRVSASWSDMLPAAWLVAGAATGGPSSTKRLYFDVYQRAACARSRGSPLAGRGCMPRRGAARRLRSPGQPARLRESSISESGFKIANGMDLIWIPTCAWRAPLRLVADSAMAIAIARACPY
jgi:hypothetical protein